MSRLPGKRDIAIRGLVRFFQGVALLQGDGKVKAMELSSEALN